MEDKITITEQSFQRLEEKETEQVTGYRHSVWKEIRKEFLSNKGGAFQHGLFIGHSDRCLAGTIKPV